MSDPLVTLSAKVPATLRDAVHKRAQGLSLSPSATVAHLLGRALEMPVGEPSVAVRVEDIEPDRLAGMLTEKQRAAVLMMRASDVLTNCDTCRHDYGVDGHRLCAIVANRGDVWNWCRENCTNAGHPKPGATGCPGWAAKENGA